MIDLFVLGTAMPMEQALSAPATGATDIVLLGKLAVAVICGVLMIVGLRVGKPMELTNSRFDWLAMILLAASRIGLFTAIFIILGQGAQSDVNKYFEEGMAILDGQVVYRDFNSSYGPLFPYLAASVLALWASAKTLVATSIVFELLSLPIWLAVARRWFAERVTRRATLLYVLSPIPLLNVAMAGHNQVWLALLLALALLFLARRDFSSGYAVGMTIVAVKLLGLLFAPVLWLFGDRRILWLIGFAILPVWVYGMLIIAGVDVLVPLKVEGHRVTSGNLLYLASITGLDLDSAAVKWGSTAILLLSLAAVYLTAGARDVVIRPRNVVHMTTLVLLTMMLMSKKAYVSYLVLAFFPICLSLASRPTAIPALVFLAVFSVAASVEPSLWFRWMGKEYLDLLWRTDLPDGVSRIRIVLTIFCELILLSGYVWIFQRAWRALWRDRDEVEAATN